MLIHQVTRGCPQDTHPRVQVLRLDSSSDATNYIGKFSTRSAHLHGPKKNPTCSFRKRRTNKFTKQTGETTTLVPPDDGAAYLVTRRYVAARVRFYTPCTPVYTLSCFPLSPASTSVKGVSGSPCLFPTTSPTQHNNGAAVTERGWRTWPTAHFLADPQAPQHSLHHAGGLERRGPPVVVPHVHCPGYRNTPCAAHWAPQRAPGRG